MDESLPPDVFADLAQALYVVQDPEAAALTSRADVVSQKRTEIEAVLGVLRRARTTEPGHVPAVDGAAEASRLMSRQQVGELFGLRKSATYDLTRRADFPLPVVISARCLRWPADEVSAFAETLRHRDLGHRTRRTRMGRSRDRELVPPSRITGSVRPVRDRKLGS